MRRLFFILTTLVLIVGFVGGTAFYLAGRAGSSPVESWIGSQLQLIANSYLNPRLSFSDLDYTFPNTVSIKNLRLTADDPANPGKTVDILGAGEATIMLGEIPSVGKPIIIEKIVLQQPQFSAVATAPGSGKYIGFSNLIRDSGAKPQQSSSAAGSSSQQLSDVFRMKLVQLIDGKLVYDPRIAGTEAMEFDQINTRLDIEAAEGGWYKLSTMLTRKPLFELSIVGQLNINSFSVRDTVLKLTADLNEQKINFLPPQLQKIIRQYELKGLLEATISGSMPLNQPEKGQAKADVSLANANVTLGEYRIPIEKLDLAMVLENGALTLPTLKIAGLQGSADVSGSATLNEQFDAVVNVKVTDMMIEDLLATRKHGEPGKIAGKINGTAHIAAPINVVIAKMMQSATPLASQPLPKNWGTMSINLVDGHLVDLPFIHDLTETIAKATKIILPSYKSSQQDKIRAALTMNGDAANFSEFTYISDFVAARGKGLITLDQRVDMILNGGPLDKMQAILGKQIGDIISMVTDKLYAFRVTGTVKDPQITVEVASGVGDELMGGVRRVGEGIGKVGSDIANIGKKEQE